jgi:hypothetical protein
MITILEEKREIIEHDLDRRIEVEDRMARRRAILSSIPGIGPRISSPCASPPSQTRSSEAT